MSDTRQPLSLDVLAARVEANQQAIAREIGKLRETLASLRQDIAELTPATAGTPYPFSAANAGKHHT